MSELPKPKWKKPSLEEEMEELERHAEESGINLDSLVTAFNSAELQELSDEDWMNMENCDSRDKTYDIQCVWEDAARIFRVVAMYLDETTRN